LHRGTCLPECGPDFEMRATASIPGACRPCCPYALPCFAPSGGTLPSNACEGKDREDPQDRNENRHKIPIGIAVDSLEMPAAFLVSDYYSALAVCVLALHALFIVWIVFGALVTNRRPLLRGLHIASLIWGVLVEVTAWPCPLTLLENWAEAKAGVEPYQGGFLLHYLDKLVYPDLSSATLTIAGLVVCGFNLAFYAGQIWLAVRKTNREKLRTDSANHL
jgi:hypothetical protein